MKAWRVMVMAAAAGVPSVAQEQPVRVAPQWQNRTQMLDRAFRRQLLVDRERREQAPTQVTPKLEEAPRPCAIPLLNVLKPSAGAKVVLPDPMIIVPDAPAQDPREKVQAPAPSCDDVKKK